MSLDSSREDKIGFEVTDPDIPRKIYLMNIIGSEILMDGNCFPITGSASLIL